MFQDKPDLFTTYNQAPWYINDAHEIRVRPTIKGRTTPFQTLGKFASARSVADDTYDIECLVFIPKPKRPKETMLKAYTISFERWVNGKEDCCQRLTDFYNKIEEGFRSMSQFKNENGKLYIHTLGLG